jgi:hypothetical protein
MADGLDLEDACQSWGPAIDTPAGSMPWLRGAAAVGASDHIMELPILASLGSTGVAGRRRYAVLLSAMLMAPLSVHAGGAADPRETQAEPAAPQVQEQDVRSLTEEAPVKRWKEGDPVRVVPDLREDGDVGTGEEQAAQQSPEPTVRAPVAPQVMDHSVNELSKIRPYREGEPVRVVPDLKESDPTE